jgi:hypothetical protein
MLTCGRVITGAERVAIKMRPQKAGQAAVDQDADVHKTTAAWITLRPRTAGWPGGPWAPSMHVRRAHSFCRLDRVGTATSIARSSPRATSVAALHVDGMGTWAGPNRIWYYEYSVLVRWLEGSRPSP